MLITQEEIARAVEQFLKKGEVSWAWLGVETLPVNRTLAKVLKLPQAEGLLVTKVYSGSPAARVGLRGGENLQALGHRIYRLGGDVLLKLNDWPLRTPEELFHLVLSKSPGERVKLEIWRRGKKRYIAVKLSRRPER